MHHLVTNFIFCFWFLKIKPVQTHSIYCFLGFVVYILGVFSKIKANYEKQKTFISNCNFSSFFAATFKMQPQNSNK